MPYFTHIHRQIDTVSELDEVADCLFGGVAAIAVASVHDFVIVGRIFERLEIAVPLRTADEHDVIGIHLANCLHRAFVERLEQCVERIHVFKVWGYWLIDEFIAEDYSFILVMESDFLPDIAEKSLALFALKQPGIAVTVVDIVAGLSAGCVVHVENKI